MIDEKALEEELYKTDNPRQARQVLESYGLKDPIYISTGEMLAILAKISHLQAIYPIGEKYIGVECMYIQSAIEELARAMGMDEREIKKELQDNPELLLLEKLSGKRITIMHGDKNEIIETFRKNLSEYQITGRNKKRRL